MGSLYLTGDQQELGWKEALHAACGNAHFLSVALILMYYRTRTLLYIDVSINDFRLPKSTSSSSNLYVQ